MLALITLDTQSKTENKISVGKIISPSETTFICYFEYRMITYTYTYVCEMLPRDSVICHTII